VLAQYRRALSATMFVFRDNKGTSAMTLPGPRGHNFFVSIGESLTQVWRKANLSMRCSSWKFTIAQEEPSQMGTGADPDAVWRQNPWCNPMDLRDQPSL